MRKIALSAIVATVAALSFTTPSQAGGFHLGQGGWKTERSGPADVHQASHG